jgi:hypothetical protein
MAHFKENWHHNHATHLYFLLELRYLSRLCEVLGGCTSGVRFPVGARDFSLLQNFQTDSGSHQDSYPMGTGRSFHKIKRSAREADHSPPYNAEVNNGWSYDSTPLYIFIAWCLIN